MQTISKWPFYTKLACVLLSLVIIGYLAIIGKTVVAPLIIGFLFSMLLIPICNFFENKLNFSRSLSSITTVVVATFAIVVIVYLIARNLTSVSQDWPMFEKQILETFNRFQAWLTTTFGIQESQQMNYMKTSISSALSSSTVWIGGLLISLSSIFLLWVFVFLYTFFFLLYRRHIRLFVTQLFKAEHHSKVNEVIENIQYMVKKYLTGLLIQMSIVATLAFIAYSIIGVKHGLLLALITGIFNVLPYIGILSALILTVIITFATSTLAHVLLVIACVVVIHAVDSNFIMPKIVGSKVKLNSMIAMLGLVIGEQMWGIAGMFLSIPVMAIFKIVFDRVDELKPWGFLLGEDNDDGAFIKNLNKKKVASEQPVDNPEQDKTSISLDE